MKKFWSRTIKVGVGIVILGGVGVAVFLQHPLFGSLPSGERQVRIERSPNYGGGAFHNQTDTPLLTTDQTQVSIMLDNMRNKGATRPPMPLRATKTDLKALDGSDNAVVWLGHSSYYVQLEGQRLLIDPVFSVNASPVPGTNVAFDGTSLYAADDMPAIDLLVITHDHYDHLDYPSVQALQQKVAKVMVPLGVGAHFERWGYDMQRVHEVDWYDSLALSPSLQLTATPARHFSGRTFTKNKTLWMGLALVTPKLRLFFSGDTGYGPHFTEIRQRFGPFDWVALDMGQYDPRWANVHMNPEQAAQAAEDLQAKVLTPAHVGRFSLSPHDWDAPFERITTASRGRGFALWTPEIGRVVQLDGRGQIFSPWWKNGLGDAAGPEPSND